MRNPKYKTPAAIDAPIIVPIIIATIEPEFPAAAISGLSAFCVLNSSCKVPAFSMVSSSKSIIIAPLTFLTCFLGSSGIHLNAEAAFAFFAFSVAVVMNVIG